MTALARIAFALVLLLGAGGPAAAVERILNFISDAVVERNGALAVTETIAVQAEGRAIQRGIQRDFPTSYHRPDGSRVEVGFEVLSVTRNGNAEEWTTENLSNGVRVRTGSADRRLSLGRHEYVIRYRTTRQIGFFRDYDELYWNATGNGWTFAIEQAEARITLPEAVPFRRAAFYTGPQDAPGQDATIVEQRPGRIVFRTTRELPPRSGLTVAVAWNKGIVMPPSGGQLERWWLADNLAVPVAIVGLILVLGFYFYAWRRVGRDPPRGTIIPLFAPPAGMSAAAVRYVSNLAFDQRCFTAAIIDAGVRGHLRITGGGDNTPVLEARQGGKPVPPAESAMVGKLFAGRPSLTLSQVNHETLGKAKEALSEGLEKAYLGKLFTNNFAWSSFGLGAVVTFILLVVVSVMASHNRSDVGGMAASILVPLLPLVFGAGLLYDGLRREPLGWLRLIGGGAIIAVSVVVGLIIIYANAYGFLDAIPSVASYAAASVAGVGFSLLQAPSLEGRKIMDQIEGFREYLGVAEEERLEYLNPPEKTPDLFERFLPYAVALDVENTWAKRFAGVLAAAGATAAAATWYASGSNWTSDPVGFADHLGSDLNTTIASASAAPGSSDSGGSSGGGSSGGGGGGGGGSGW